MAHTPMTRTYSRRALLRSALGITGVAALAACGGANTTPTAGTAPPTGGGTPIPPAGTSATAAGANTTAPATTAASTVRATATGGRAAVEGKLPDTGVPGVPDAYTKYPPVYKSVSGVPGRGGTVTTFQVQEGAPIPAKGENRFWQELERRLGVRIEPTFAPSASWAEKFAALTAGGDLPDLCWLHPSDSRASGQYKTIQQGAFTDLTPYLSGDALKEYPNLAALPPQLWDKVRINRKIYGAPRPQLAVGQALYFRQDWAEKVGVPRVESAESLFTVLTRFSKNDPDGNGQADTYGLAGPTPAARFCQTFLLEMFRAPNGWRLNPDKTLTHEIETEEYKQALAFAKRLWEGGGYHPDLLSLSISQVRDGLTAGTLGAFQGFIVSLSNRRAMARQVNPAADVISLAPPGHDGGKAVTHNGPGFLGFTGIPSKVGRDKERVRELLRILDYYAAPFGSEEDLFFQFGIEGLHHKVAPDGTRSRTEQGQLEIGGLRSLMNNPPVFFYPAFPGDAAMMQELAARMLAVGIDDPTEGLYSPTAIAKSSELSQLRTDRETAVVVGREPFGALEQMIKDWRSRGGDQIRQEYEAALTGQ